MYFFESLQTVTDRFFLTVANETAEKIFDGKQPQRPERTGLGQSGEQRVISGLIYFLTRFMGAGKGRKNLDWEGGYR